MDAERLAESWMRSSGFPGARLTGGSADAGIDVKAVGAIAQVKMETRPVGRPALQRLVGARGTNTTQRLLFFSSSGYSTAAREYAQSMNIALLTYSLEGVVSPVNSHARTIRSSFSTSTGGGGTPATTEVGALLFAALAVALIFPFAVTWLIAWAAGASNLWASLTACAVLAVLGLVYFGWSSRSEAKTETARLAAVRAKTPGPSLFDL